MIKFYNIKYGETRTVTTGPMLAAFFNSTNLHVNAMVGQDLGWRIHPETVAQIRKIQMDEDLIEKIEKKFSVPSGELQEIDILRWISLEEERKEAQKTYTEQNNYNEEYERQVRAIRAGQDVPSASLPGDESKDHAPNNLSTTGNDDATEQMRDKLAKEAKAAKIAKAKAKKEEDAVLAKLQDDQRILNGEAPTGIAARAPEVTPDSLETDKLDGTSSPEDNKDGKTNPGGKTDGKK